MLRVQGGPVQGCETVRNIMVGVSPAAFFLDMTGGILSASAAFATHFLCEYLKTPIVERWTCCGGLNGTQGCKVRFQCCKNKPNHQGCCVRYPCCFGGAPAQGCQKRYKCCGLLENSAGCEKRCKKCGSPWGSAANQCFTKSHNLAKND